MKGPLHVIRRRRSESDANETDAAQPATEAPTEAQPTVDPGSAAAAPAVSQTPPTEESPAEQVPAGQEPVPERPTFRNRGRLRRRLRYLRRVRELGFRDLGGLVFDQHKFASINDELVRGKLTALAAVDSELRALEHALDDRRALTELREPGISVCPRCGALHGSDARYCPSCGVPVRGPRAIAEVGEAVSLSVGQIGAVATPSGPPPSAQPPAQLSLQSERAGAEPATPGAEQATPGAEQPAAAQPAATQQASGEQPTQVAPAAQQPSEEQPTQAAPANGGDQPTEAMRPVDGDGVHGAVAQPSGERREP
jgi:ribosomal protein L40E